MIFSFFCVETQIKSIHFHYICENLVNKVILFLPVNNYHYGPNLNTQLNMQRIAYCKWYRILVCD